jgi:hypothetical protein
VTSSAIASSVARAFAGNSKPHAPSPTVGLELCDADVGHRDLLEQVWRSDDRGGISRQFGSELRMPECSPVVNGRFPDGIVEIRRAFAKSSVKLGGDEARLAPHESSVVLPSLEKGLLVRFIERVIPTRRRRPDWRRPQYWRRSDKGARSQCRRGSLRRDRLAGRRARPRYRPNGPWRQNRGGGTPLRQEAPSWQDHTRQRRRAAFRLGRSRRQTHAVSAHSALISLRILSPYRSRVSLTIRRKVSISTKPPCHKDGLSTIFWRHV